MPEGKRCSWNDAQGSNVSQQKCVEKKGNKLGKINSGECLVPCLKEALCVFLGPCDVPERKDIFLLLANKVDLIFEEEKCAQIIWTFLLKIFKPSNWISIGGVGGSCGDTVEHQGKDH